MQRITLDYEIPEILAPIYEPKRYKVLYGGRGGAKSWGVARALLDLGTRKPIRVLCAREFQNSITDSVHKLLSNQIKELGLVDFYEVQRTRIIGINGTEFGFEGLKHNINNLKSYEGADICWVEEAQTVSKDSWGKLVPTIRKENSEIWVTFNPELEHDETYQRFIVHPQEDALVIKVGWQDNPWFPDILKKEKDHLKSVDYDDYLNVWEGQCKQALEGAVYKNELRKAQEENRITNVPYDATKPVSTFFDLGWADKTSIWFAQSVGFEYRIIDFYENRQQPISHYVQVLQNKGYVYDTDWLPHDAQANQLGTGRSIENLMRSAGRKVQVLPRTSVEQGINAARTIFQQCYFDKSKCADGLQALRHYRYDIDEAGKWSNKPLHDENSHAADAFRYLALALTTRRTQNHRKKRSISWMS